jgi:hypothetical protein
VKYYEVGGYTFTHYGKALSFARAIDGSVKVKRTYNVFKIIYAAI